MIANVKHHEISVVSKNGLFQIDDAWIRLVGLITFDKTAIELDDDRQGELFALRIIQSANGLYQLSIVSNASRESIHVAYHQSVIVRCLNCYRH